MRQKSHMEPLKSALNQNYKQLRALSSSSNIYLCMEHATQRMLVVKAFTKKHNASFQNEAKKLQQLKNFNAAPSLYFALSANEASYIGMEYRQGQTLLQWCQSANQTETTAVFLEIEKQLNTLHGNFRITHCDLSPQNILIYTKKSQTENSSNNYQVTFIDWEFSKSLQYDNTNNYQSYQGTLGFQPINNSADLYEKDWQALNNCKKHVNYTPEINYQIKNQKWKNWLPWI